MQQRQTTTKSDIKEAFIQILATRNLEDITISQLTKKAGVNRSTFYLHYLDKQDFLEQLKEEIKQAIEKYLLSLRKNWGISDDVNRYSLTIYRSQITAKILGVIGVANVSEIKINNKLEDLVLLENSITQQLPVLGEVVLS